MDNIIKINNTTREVTPSKDFLGVQYENSIENLVFELDEFIEGEGTLDIEKTSKEGKIKQYYLPLENKENKYILEVKNILLDVNKPIKMQFHITSNNKEVFRSKFFELKVLDSIDTNKSIEEEYQQVVDVANEKIIFFNKFEKDLAAGKFNGKDGEQGPAGDTGPSGYTPRKNIDYFDGKDGLNGKDGIDGYTPQKNIDYFDGDSAYEIAVKHGYQGTEEEWLNTFVKGEKGDPGPAGEPGLAGYTPQKNIDYFDGKDGKDGKDGISGTIDVGQVQTGEPETDVIIENVGTSTNAILNFTIPKGAKGEDGLFGDTLPIGAITQFSSDNIPTNWLLCDGREVSRAEYAQLFDVIGIKYGTGDGSNTFNLPNFKGRVAVGKDDNDTDFNSLNKTGGEKKHILTIEEMPKHSHKVSRASVGQDGGSDWTIESYPKGVAQWNTNEAGNDQPHNNLQPYIVTNYIIKAFQSVGLVADVANSETDSDTDVYSCNYINNIKSILDKLKVQQNFSLFSTDTSISVGSGTRVPLNSLIKNKGDFFRVDQYNRIIINKGVSRIEISGSIFLDNPNRTGYLWAQIRKNQYMISGSINPYSAGGFISGVIPPTVIDVKEGDWLDLIADSTCNGSIRTNSTNTWLYIKAIE